MYIKTNMNQKSWNDLVLKQNSNKCIIMGCWAKTSDIINTMSFLVFLSSFITRQNILNMVGGTLGDNG